MSRDSRAYENTTSRKGILAALGLSQSTDGCFTVHCLNHVNQFMYERVYMCVAQETRGITREKDAIVQPRKMMIMTRKSEIQAVSSMVALSPQLCSAMRKGSRA